VIEDFYNREGTARVFENVAPALRAGREGLKVVCSAGVERVENEN
jgi:hypothetical protein